MTASTALEALPPSVGDAPVAALLLRDVVAGLATGTPGRVDPAAVEVTDDGRFHLATATPAHAADDLAHAPLAAPELFRGSAPDARSDVYAAACLALTRYLGSAPVAAAPVGVRSTAAARLGALRHAQRTVPARLGALPAPFRDVFARAVAKERHLRPTPAVLLADLDAALAASGGEAAARQRVHRLVVLARVFEPGAGSALRPPVAVPAAVAAAPLHLPIRSLSPRLPQRATRFALVAAVTVVATGGVAVAAVVGLSGSDTRPVPQAVATLTSTSPTARSSSPVATTSSAAPVAATSVAPVAAAPVAGTGGGSGGGGGVSCLRAQDAGAVALDDPSGTPTSSDSSSPSSSNPGPPAPSATWSPAPPPVTPPSSPPPPPQTQPAATSAAPAPAPTTRTSAQPVSTPGRSTVGTSSGC